MATAYVEIPLTQGYVALVDVDDYFAVRRYRWCAARHPGRVYAVGWIPRAAKPAVRMHAFLTGFRRTDHHDGDGLNNRRSNLREASHAQNMRNRRAQPGGTSQYKGVSQGSGRRQWKAHIRVDRVQYYLGCFDTEEQAARAYDDAARRWHGTYAALNFPQPGEQGAHRDSPERIVA